MLGRIPENGSPAREFSKQESQARRYALMPLFINQPSEVEFQRKDRRPIQNVYAISFSSLVSAFYPFQKHDPELLLQWRSFLL